MTIELDSERDKKYHRIRDLLRNEDVVEAKLLLKDGTSLSYKNYRTKVTEGST